MFGSWLRMPEYKLWWFILHRKPVCLWWPGQLWWQQWWGSISLWTKNPETRNRTSALGWWNLCRWEAVIIISICSSLRRGLRNSFYFFCATGHKKCGNDHFHCRVSNQCVKKRYLCDSRADCYDKSDEDPDMCRNRSSSTIWHTFYYKHHSIKYETLTCSGSCC